MKTISKICFFILPFLVCSNPLSAQLTQGIPDSSMIRPITADVPFLVMNNAERNSGEGEKVSVESHPANPASSVFVSGIASATTGNLATNGTPSIVINQDMVAIYRRFMDRPSDVDYWNYTINFRVVNIWDAATMRKLRDVYLGISAPDSVMLATNQLIRLGETQPVKSVVFPLPLPADTSFPPIVIRSAKKDLVSDTMQRLRNSKSSEVRKVFWIGK